MTAAMLAATVALGTACGGAGTVGDGTPEVIAFSGATVVDGTGAEPIADAVIVARGGRIECVGTAEDCPVPGDAEVFDATGSWIVPGLVDAHVHFAQTAWADGRPDGMNVEDDYPYERVVAEREAEPGTYFRSYLCSGVTAVFDVGGFPWSWDLREEAATDPLAPHVAAAGPLVTWVDPRMSLPAEQVMVRLSSEEAGREAVRYMAAFDSDAVKLWFLSVPEEGVEETSSGSADTRRLAREEIDARVLALGEEARSLGLPLIVHATSLREAKVALRAGASLLVHSVSDRPVDDEFLELARQAGTIYTPTLIVGDNWSAMIESAATGETPEIDDPNGCVDPETRSKILSTPEYRDHPMATALRAEPGRLEARRESLRRQAGVMADNLRRVHQAGIPVAMGTDAGNPFTVHGPSVYAEMERMQAAGLSPVEVLVAATRDAARAMGREAEIGTLEAGKVADLAILADDPLADIANLRTITHVARAGRVTPVSELSY